MRDIQELDYQDDLLIEEGGNFLSRTDEPTCRKAYLTLKMSSTSIGRVHG